MPLVLWDVLIFHWRSKAAELPTSISDTSHNPINRLQRVIFQTARWYRDSVHSRRTIYIKLTGYKCEHKYVLVKRENWLIETFRAKTNSTWSNQSKQFISPYFVLFSVARSANVWRSSQPSQCCKALRKCVYNTPIVQMLHHFCNWPREHLGNMVCECTVYTESHLIINYISYVTIPQLAVGFTKCRAASRSQWQWSNRQMRQEVRKPPSKQQKK